MPHYPVLMKPGILSGKRDYAHTYPSFHSAHQSRQPDPPIYGAATVWRDLLLFVPLVWWSDSWRKYQNFHTFATARLLILMKRPGTSLPWMYR